MLYKIFQNILHVLTSKQFCCCASLAARAGSSVVQWWKYFYVLVSTGPSYIDNRGVGRR